MRVLPKLGLLAAASAALYFRHRVPATFEDYGMNSLPMKATAGAAGYDIVAPHTYELQPGETHVFDLGWTVVVPRGWYVSVQTRSSMSIKRGLVLANGTEGIIDSDYRDSIKLAIRNLSDEPQLISKDDRIAQFVLKRYDTAVWVPMWVSTLLTIFSPSKRSGGLGSTGA